MSKELLIITALFIVGNVLAWFQANSQFLWEWWYERPLLTVVIYAVPTSLAFFYGWRYAVESLGGSLWAARMFAFGVATIVFGFMSYIFKGEGITAKTAVCLALSVLIICIQIMWKTE